MFRSIQEIISLPAFTLYYENRQRRYEMISWIDRNIPPGHRMRTGRTMCGSTTTKIRTLVISCRQRELDTMVRCACHARRAYPPILRLPGAFSTAYIGGCFYWHFRQTMVPSGTFDWTVLQSLMLAA